MVTIHLGAGQTIKQLLMELAALSGGAKQRLVSGRVGVLVDAKLAHRYLAQRLGLDVPAATVVDVGRSETPEPEPSEAPAEIMAPAKKKTPAVAPAAKSRTKKAVTATVSKKVEV